MNWPAVGSDTLLHVRGESKYIDDQQLPAGTLFAAVVPSPLARGRISSIDISKAMTLPDVVGIYTARDIPGENQIGGIFPDEALLPEEHLHYIGQPVAVTAARTQRAARRAAAAVLMVTEEEPPVLDPREAARRGEIIGTPRVFTRGNIDTAWDECGIIVEGRVETGGQEHLYLETQGCIAVPREDGGMKIISSTQGPALVQKMVSRILGIEMHRTEVEVPRLGGAFGGKEEQATVWACLAALASRKSGRPVKLVLNRRDDLRMTGKRHPYSCDYRLGLSRDGKLLAYEVTFYQNAGAHADLSSAVLERSMFHAAGSYFIPHFKATGYSCRTNLPPNTAFRGFGGPQAMFVLEAAIFRAAEELKVHPSVIQEKNLLKDGDTFHYGMGVKGCTAGRCFSEAAEGYGLEGWIESVEAFNRDHRDRKKGLAVMPVCFGISFTNATLNQAGALVHVYGDGSVAVSTGAVEMGQGVKRKILQTAARVLSIEEEEASRGMIRVEYTNTTRTANTSPTAASTGSDLNGKATEQACTIIRDRLLTFAAPLVDAETIESLDLREGKLLKDGTETGITWQDLVSKAYLARIDLSAHGFYATPGIRFDKETETGEPFAYHAYGTGIVEATIDCIRGTYRFDRVAVLHDAGKVLNYDIDRGQSEGGIVQGLGWLTVEELVYSDTGRLMADTMSNCKIPDIYFVPDVMDIRFLERSPNPMGVFNSKAIGEPPFMYGIAGYFAVLAAARAAGPAVPRHADGGDANGSGAEVPLSLIRAPMTPERLLYLLEP